MLIRALLRRLISVASARLVGSARCLHRCRRDPASLLLLFLLLLLPFLPLSPLQSRLGSAACLPWAVLR